MRPTVIGMAAFLPVLLGGCTAVRPAGAGAESRTAPAGQIVRVTLYSFPGGVGSWAVAYREFHPDGRVEGGHVSGGPDKPREYMDKKQIGPDLVKQVWEEAAALAAVWQPRWSVDQQSNHLAIILTYADGTELRAAWASDQKPPCPEAQRLFKTLGEVNVGAW